MESAPLSGSPSPLPPTAEQQAAPSSKHNRVVWHLVGAFFLLLGLCAWLFFHDDPAPETSDLLPRWSRSQDPANPLSQFCTIASNAPLFWGRIGDKEIIEFEQSNSAVFQHFQQLINSPVETWAWTDHDNLLTWFKVDPIHLPISGIKNYLAAKHDLALTKDDQEEALICATRLLKLGTGIAGAESDLHRLDLGTDIYFAGLKALKANRTLQWRATSTREILAALEEGGALTAYLRGQEQIAAIRPMEADRNRWSYLADGNYAGKHFHIGWTSSTPTFLSTVMASTAIHHAIQIELALRLYQIDHHQLPASLNDLVPTYLSSVPLDPFSNAPMRWNKVTQVVYSVGTNLVDDHGDAKPLTYLHKLMDQRDIGITIASKNMSDTPGLPNPPSPEGGPALDDY